MYRYIVQILSVPFIVLVRKTISAFIHDVTLWWRHSPWRRQHLYYVTSSAYVIHPPGVTSPARALRVFCIFSSTHYVIVCDDVISMMMTSHCSDDIFIDEYFDTTFPPVTRVIIHKHVASVGTSDVIVAIANHCHGRKRRVEFLPARSGWLHNLDDGNQ